LFDESEDMGYPSQMKNRNILIVGGNSGIGAALVEKYVNNGDAVHLALRQPSAVNQAVASIQEYDALQKNEAQLKIPEILDSVIYCPGSIQLKPFHRTDDAQMLSDMEVNAFGAARMIQAALPALKKSSLEGGASVILFSSVAAQTGLAFHASISMAKAAVEGLTLSLASELAPSNIRVNAIAPSLTDTPLASMLLNSDAKREAAGSRHPLKRVGTANGVASMVNYLISEDAAFVTGQIFKLDGGLSSIR